MTRVSLRDEHGSTLPLICFYGALALLVTLIVASATSLYLERKRLFTLADGAALVGAESFELDEVAMTPDGPRATL
ncbi:MAG: pilus assembly protein TadG-related protein, partial [Pseudolysinimonas sp.]